GVLMKRRDFIALCGGAVVCPVATSAQEGERVRLIGILNILGRDDPEAQVRLTIFQEALKQLGWERGRDFKIESRQAGADVHRLRRYAAELVALGPDVILSIGSISVGALQQATHTIPICLRERSRSGWRGFRAKHGPSGRQYHWLLKF